jgi:hypothetical protein
VLIPNLLAPLLKSVNLVAWFFKKWAPLVPAAAVLLMSTISQSSGSTAGILVTTECALRAQIYLLYDKLTGVITGIAELPSCCEGNVLGADHTIV